MLVEFGVLAGADPFFRQSMSLAECEQADFSDSESLHNYLHCWFTFDQVIYFQIGYAAAGQTDVIIPLEYFSPRFRDRVAHADDIFSVSNGGVVAFDPRRYNEKVLTRWRATLDRRIRWNSSQA